MWGLFSTWTSPPNWLSVFAESFESNEVPGQLPNWNDKYWAACERWAPRRMVSSGPRLASDDVWYPLDVCDRLRRRHRHHSRSESGLFMRITLREFFVLYA